MKKRDETFSDEILVREIDIVRFPMKKILERVLYTRNYNLIGEIRERGPVVSQSK